MLLGYIRSPARTRYVVNNEEIWVRPKIIIHSELQTLKRLQKNLKEQNGEEKKWEKRDG